MSDADSAHVPVMENEREREDDRRDEKLGLGELLRMGDCEFVPD